jgi:hypothetical protein
MVVVVGFEFEGGEDEEDDDDDERRARDREKAVWGEV